MKHYLITEDQFGDLFSIGLLSAIFFSLATGCFGFAVDVYKDLSLSESIAENVKTKWEIITYACFFLSFVFIVMGGGFVMWGKNKISGIKKNTVFEE